MHRTSRSSVPLVACVSLVFAISVGCLARPVGTEPPTTKDNFTSQVAQQAVDKVDILFAIDNSGSMLDKQKILSAAVPNLLDGLLHPKCVDIVTSQPIGTQTADPNADKAANFGCPKGSQPEFTPVTDMHIGVVSSSLGTMGGDYCPESMARFNDHAELLKSADIAQTMPLADASPSGFLSWFPANDVNSDGKRHPKPPTPAILKFDDLKSDFQSLVTGVGQSGCGLEAQLESVFHFLVAPDPWRYVGVSTDGKASYGDIDETIIQERADFLRPDSLVAVIMLTDEDDSSADPLSIGGTGWNFANHLFVGSTQGAATNPPTSTAPRGTSICATNPLSDDCTSCAFGRNCQAGDQRCLKIAADPECQKTDGYYTVQEESINTRFMRMKERFGIDPQYPISRYVDAFSKTTVPGRDHEHDINGTYVGTANCTNPLFARTLPNTAQAELCRLPRGTRTPDQIFFAVVGGVPNTLVKATMTDADWYAVLGKDPLHFDYSNIDPHMIQSIGPRPGIPGPSNTRGDNGTDPIVGRDWDTQNQDLQYACTFALPAASQTTDPSGDCAAGKNPPLCGPNPGEQIRAKAYPTVRELEVVRALKNQGIIASLCPQSLTVDPSDPTYGYNPAVQAIIDRLKNALKPQCLPEKLTREADQTVSCLVLAVLGDDGDSCDKHDGLTVPKQDVLDRYRQQLQAASGDTSDGGIDLSKRAICQLNQLTPEPDTGSCTQEPSSGWCYVENQGAQHPAGNCPQAILFSTGTTSLAGATFDLQCINQSAVEAGAGGP